MTTDYLATAWKLPGRSMVHSVQKIESTDKKLGMTHQGWHHHIDVAKDSKDSIVAMDHQLYLVLH